MPCVRLARLPFFIVGLVLVTRLLDPPAAAAATFTVASLGDGADVAPGNGVCADAGGACTLRAAIGETNALAGADAVTITAAGTIALGSALPVIAQDLMLTGPGAGSLTIDGGAHGSVLEIGGGVTASVADLTITNGLGSGGGGNLGGAFNNHGTLMLSRLRVLANVAGYGGGGVFNDFGADLMVSDCTFDGNLAIGGFGGAIYNVGGGTFVTISGSTFSRNTAFNGAVNAPGGTSIAISNSTFSGNTATGAGGTAGVLGGPNVTMTHCTVVANTGRGVSSPKLRNSIVDSCGTSQSLGYNLVPSAACFVSPATSDVIAASFGLGALQANGGPTDTVAVLPGSPALDAVPPAACPLATDQRGVARPQGAGCEIGAFELASTPTPTASATPTPSPTPTASATSTVLTPTPSGHAEICITKFNDLNGNGVHEAGEPGLAGWKVQISDLAGNPLILVTTLAAGTICTGVPAAATYAIFEVPQLGWTQTFPTAPGLHIVSVTPGQLLDLEFGNQRTTSGPSPTPSPTPTASPSATATPSPTATAPCANPPAGMVAWWPLDELPGATTIDDLAGIANAGTPRSPSGAPNAISATLGNAPVPVTSPPLSLPSGMVAGALYFYGPYIEVPDQTELDFGSGDFSIDAWVWPPPPTGAGAGVSPIVDKLDPAAPRGYAFYLAHAAGGPYNVPTLRLGDGAFTTVAASLSLTHGMWNHVAVTVQRGVANGVVFYVNGATAGTATVGAGNSDDAQPLWIGRSRLSPPAAFAEVAVDEIELFDRALTGLEVQAIAAAGSGGKCKPPRCPGDCNRDARVTIDELVRGVGMALGSNALGECAGFDTDADTRVSIAELVRAVGDALDGCPMTTLQSPEGITLRLDAARLAVHLAARDATQPAGLTLELAGELVNGSPQALYLVAGIAPERGDLGVEVAAQRKVCKHKFLWWGWDCFTYENLRQSNPVIVPEDPTTMVTLGLDAAQRGPRNDGAPADLALGIAATHDVRRIAAALDLDPETIRLGAPLLPAGGRLPLRLSLPMRVEGPPSTPTGALPLRFAVTLADDTGPAERIGTSDCAVFFEPADAEELRLGAGCGYWSYLAD
ncbi:MAG: choice-of-anchor Q domain-containing protein [Deltaproteobacteria bacterium]|nr:choice-of-anchor Q domain-containing protein [Deltaproteobacteria bacterium]